MVSFIMTMDDVVISTHDLVLCVLWGAGISGMAHLIFILSARYIGATELTLFGILETAFAPFWVWWLMSETPSIWVMAGGLVILIAIGIKLILEVRSVAG